MFGRDNHKYYCSMHTVQLYACTGCFTDSNCITLQLEGDITEGDCCTAGGSSFYSGRICRALDCGGRIFILYSTAFYLCITY